MIALVVEDSPIKGKALLDLLERSERVRTVILEKSYQGALRRIEVSPPDVIILDMTLPNFDVEPGVRTGKPRPLGGYDILRKLQRRGVTTSVIVVTQYESFDSGAQTFLLSDLDRKCREEFPHLHRRTIYFSPTNMKWADELTAALDELGANDD